MQCGWQVLPRIQRPILRVFDDRHDLVGQHLGLEAGLGAQLALGCRLVEIAATNRRRDVDGVSDSTRPHQSD